MSRYSHASLLTAVSASYLAVAVIDTQTARSALWAYAIAAAALLTAYYLRRDDHA